MHFLTHTQDAMHIWENFTVYVPKMELSHILGKFYAKLDWYSYSSKKSATFKKVSILKKPLSFFAQLQVKYM